MKAKEANVERRKTGRRKTGTREWATHSVNCCLGCSNGCLYCYAAHNAGRFGRRARTAWTREEVYDPFPTGHTPRHGGRVMFPTTHDITPGTLATCQGILSRLLAAANDVLIVSKANSDCIARLMAHIQPDPAAWPWYVAPRPELRVSIGSLDDDLLRFWEPSAPDVESRLAALNWARCGWPTSVSCEPLLDPNHVEDLVSAVAPLCAPDDAGCGGEIWIGYCNQIRQRTAWAFRQGSPFGRDQQEKLEAAIANLEQWQTPQSIIDVFHRCQALPARVFAKLRWKDSYAGVLRALGHVVEGGRIVRAMPEVGT